MIELLNLESFLQFNTIGELDLKKDRVSHWAYRQRIVSTFLIYEKNDL